MVKRFFGTDGLRGRVNEFPMLPETVLRLGLAAGQYFRNGKKRHKVLIGKDTRISGYIFETALTSGLCAAGMDVMLVGPMPTPAISFLTRSMRCDLGVVISASHNPYYDNGIKFFDSQGYKLPDAVEDEIADLVLDPCADWDYPPQDRVGKTARVVDSMGRYVVTLKHTFPADRTLDGVKVVLDCANGATYRVAPMVLGELGAEVVAMGVSPDGTNINEGCGSLHPDKVAARVVAEGADIGLALDGDGDRLIVVDEKGTVLDGDQIMALCAQDKMERGALCGNLLVATVMSNMALEVFMRERGGTLLRTPVGDRYVAEAMRSRGAVLGGEQSGHLIFSNYSTTGDGILAALQLLRIMTARSRPLSELAGLLTPYPQELINIPVAGKRPFEELPELMDAVAQAEAELAGRGRVLLRYSGTEPKARVMVEGQDAALVRSLADALADLVRRLLN
ncbi:phosphoglucosamine mutase [Desulfocurvus sp.]|jgi:phosphoglucosamine mutase|uniref:phosphoglucosamine mutase n=1 Tax=Desulfocurvus sp. TaxID=2871698 RepID=UPI0025C2E1E5|nr:phosphoglucosamine mutase [Desulfocurvus sp.]MCK9239876.1 phosphoglucosamine mutase [Desulfocurvus sp.]